MTGSTNRIIGSNAGLAAEMPMGPVVIRVRINDMRLVNETNARENWHVRAKRAKTQRYVAAIRCIERCRGLSTPMPPLTILITRIGPIGLDSDNLAASGKHVRDGIADWLGVNDGSPLLDWRYAQKREGRGVYAVEIEIAGRL